MAKLVNSPPEAYESFYAPDIRRTHYFDEPHPWESDQNVSQRLKAMFDMVKRGRGHENFLKFADAEMRFLGFDPATVTQEQFWPAHRQLVQELDGKIAERVDANQSLVMDRLAKDLADESLSYEELMQLFQDRTKDTWTGVQDPWRGRVEAAVDINASGSHIGSDRGIEIKLAGLVYLSYRKVHEDIDEEIDELTKHEIMHSLFAVWYQPEHEFVGVLSNGLDILGKEPHGGWLNEATIEKYKKRRLGSKTFAYETGVLVLEVADAIDPDYEKMRLRAAVLNEGRGQVIGKLESIFGPLAFEKIDELINQCDEIEKISQFKTELMALLDKDRRQQADVVFDRVVEQIHQKYAKHLESKRQGAFEEPLKRAA